MIEPVKDKFVIEPLESGFDEKESGLLVKTSNDGRYRVGKIIVTPKDGNFKLNEWVAYDSQHAMFVPDKTGNIHLVIDERDIIARIKE